MSEVNEWWENEEWRFLVKYWHLVKNSSLILLSKKDLQDIWDAPETLIPQINLSQETQSTLAPIPKKMHQYIYPESGFETRYEHLSQV